jgi:predicted nucleic acid-binding protein
MDAMSHDLPAYVLDAFAVMCYLNEEPGTDRLAAILASAQAEQCAVSLCSVNWAEVRYSILRTSGREALEAVMTRLDAAPVLVVAADKHLSAIAADLKAPGGLSLADCYAAALAQTLDATLVTGDPEFKRVADVVRIEWLPTATA